MSKRRRRRTVKAQIPTARQGARSAVDRVNVMTQQTQSANVGEATPLPRDPAWSVVPFAPSQPIPPSAINQPRSDTNRAEPRLAEMPVGWNLPGSSHRHLPWYILREAADRISLFRRCIQIRKDHIQGLDWGFRISPDAIAAAQLTSGGSPKARVQRDMREGMSDAIARAKKFWAVPDRGQDYEWGEWLGLLLEETYVLDALAIYPKFTYGGELHSFEIIDGSLIKPLRDERGGRPQPPLPAYQQILWGFPRGEFTATTDDAGNVAGAMAADDLVYKRRVVRTQSPYGYSAVEQALDDGDLYLKRHHWLKAEYTVGSMPMGMFEVAADAGLTPQQVADLERFYNDLLSGSTEERMKARFLPPGITPSQRGDIGEKYKPEYDLHLLKLVISHFDTVLPELGFSEAKGLGSDGYHEGQSDVQHRKTLPILKFVSGIITRLSHRYLGVPDDVEHYFLGLDEEDEAAADELEAKRWADGVITTNERRQRLGLDPYPFEEANKPLVKLARDIIFLEGAGQTGDELGVDAQPPGGQPDQSADGQDDEEDGVEPAVQPKPGQSPKDAEKAAYRRWVRKGRSRAFEWHHHNAAEVAELAKAGDAGPKEPDGQQWPAWEIDQETAKYWAAEISQAFDGISTDRLAERWTAVRKDADSDAWLSDQGISLTDALRQVLHGVYGDGYVIGLHSARFALEQATDPSVRWTTDWGAWKPGDRAAAKAIAGPGLERLLEQSEVTIRSVAKNRMIELGDALADGLNQGLGSEEIARTLRDVLNDPGWAYGVAVTETARAVTYASHETYRQNGVDQVIWLAAPGACQLCRDNAEAGPVRLGQPFPSGVSGPPTHPHDRCATAPYFEPLTDI